MTRRGELAWLALIWAAGLAFLAPILFFGRSLWYRDTAYADYAMAQVTAEALRAWRLPLWEPLLGLGAPYLAMPVSAVIYPPTLLLVLLPFPLAYNAFVGSHVLIAGTGMYLYARRLELPGSAAALAALVMMFCGFTVVTTGQTSFLRGLAWMPLALWAFDRFVDRPGFRPVAATALVLAMQGGGTDPQFVLFTGAMLFAVPFVRSEPGRASARQIVGGVLAVGALAGLLLAFQYGPLAEVASNSNRSTLSMEELASFPVPLAWLSNLVLPLSFPDPTTPAFLANFPLGVEPLIACIYYGVLALALALAGVAAGPACALTRGARAAAVLTLAAVLVAAGNDTPAHRSLLALVPPLKMFRYPCKYFTIAALWIPLLVGRGFAAVAAREPAALRGFRAALAIAVAASGAAWLAVRLRPTECMTAYLAGGPLQGVPRPVADALVDHWRSNLLFAGALSAGALALLSLAGRGVVRWGILVAALFGAAAGDLALTTSACLFTVPGEKIATPPTCTRLIREAELRRGAAPGDPPPRYATYVVGHNYTSLSEAPFDATWQRRELGELLAGMQGGCSNLLGAPSIRLADAGTLVENTLTAPRGLGLRMVAATGTRWFVSVPTAGSAPPAASTTGVQINELAGVPPRAFVAGRAIAVPRTAATTATLLTMPGVVEYDAPPGPDLAPRTVRRCAFASYGPDRLAVDVDVAEAGLLVVLDAWYPGWAARVDGQPRPIHRVAGAFRGVVVHPGEKRVEMIYEAKVFWIGAAISLLTLALSAFACFRSFADG